MTASWIWGRALNTLWPASWHCAKVRSALWLHLKFGEEHGVLCDQPLGTVPKCRVLYDCILNLGKNMEYFVTSPLALCQSAECFMTASWIWGRAWSTLWPAPWHCAKVRSALWLHLEFGEEHRVLCDQPLGTASKCGELYDCILNLGKSMEYFVTRALALCQSVECFMTAVAFKSAGV